MNKIIYICCLTLVLFATSCSDWIDLKPVQSLTQDEYWRTQEDVESVLMGAYQHLAGSDHILFQWGEIRGDMIQGEKVSNTLESILSGKLSDDHALFKWERFYVVINYCNYVLKFAPEVKKIDPTFTDVELEGYKAEALFLRSLSYFYLVRAFKDVPLILRPSETNDQDFFYAKSTETVILDQLIDDLKSAVPIVLDEYGDTENNKGRANKGAIYSLLADIYLWKEDYQNAVDYCDLVIDDNQYLLMPKLYWGDIFYPGNSVEGIFELQFDQSKGQSNSLFGLLENDKIFKANPIVEDYLSSLDIYRQPKTYNSISYSIVKYTLGRSGSNLSSANWIVYRLADIYLMKAEALVQLQTDSGNEEALEIINMVRERAGLPVVSVTSNKRTLEDYVLDERARELAFEGKRWWDLLRLGRRNNFERKNDLISKMIIRAPSIDKLMLASRFADPDGWYFPIYYKELESNSNLVQNPFYDTSR